MTIAQSTFSDVDLSIYLCLYMEVNTAYTLVPVCNKKKIKQKSTFSLLTYDIFWVHGVFCGILLSDQVKKGIYELSISDFYAKKYYFLTESIEYVAFSAFLLVPSPFI